MPNSKSIIQISERIHTRKIKKLFEKLGIEKYLKELHSQMIVATGGTAVNLQKDGYQKRILVYPDKTISKNAEKEIIDDLLSCISEDDVFLDIGANFGRYCCVVSSVYKDADVIAVEPNPATAETLRKNIESNGLRGDVFEYALSDYEGEMTLSMTDTTGLSRLDTFKRTESEDSTLVRVNRGDAFIQHKNLPSPTIIKIDVEGAEFDVIAGMESTLKKDRFQLLYCEVHPFLLEKFGATEEKLYEKLTQLGFSFEVLEERNVEYSDGEEVQKLIKAKKGS